MKKFFFALIVLFVAFSLNATVSLIAGANPQVIYDSFPNFNLALSPSSDEYKNRGFYTTIQDEYYRYYERDSFFDIGLNLNDEHFNLVFDIDLRETLNSFYKRNYYSNIPYQFDTLNDILDINFPRYAYGEINYGKFFMSLGRRPISWGPGSYQFTISRDVPFLDNVWTEYRTDIHGGSFSYNFVFIGFNNRGLRYSTLKPDSSEDLKTVVAHRLEWDFGFFRFSIGELNLIYNRYPVLFDMNPFGVYHNIYQEGSNVMAYLEVEGVVELGRFGKVRLFGEVEMDDFSLPTEEEKGKPTAFGIGGGLQWHILDESCPTLQIKTNSEKYCLSSISYVFTSGLNITYEVYFCNPYNYNREFDAGKFTIPLHTDGNQDLFSPNAMYLGFKYGPNSFYQELRVNYASGQIAIASSVGLLIRGNGYTIDSPCGSKTIGTGDIDYNAVYTLNGERMATILLNAECKYLYAPGLQIEARVSAAFDTYNVNVK